MPAFGLGEQSTACPSSLSCGTMNEYATPYNPSMPFYTLTPNSGSPITSSAAVPYAYPVISSPEPGGSGVYYYDSGYSPYCYAPYGSDLTSSRDPQYSQDWYVGSSISPPSQPGWYSEDGHSAISYYPEVGSYENNGFYAYQPPPYHSHSHGDPFASSTIVTATPWENCPNLPSSNGAPVSADFFSPFQDAPTAGYAWCESDDTQNQKDGEDSSSTLSESHHVKLEEQQTADKSRDRSKQANNSWQGNVSPTVGMEHLHAISTCLNAEDHADIKSTKSSDGFALKKESSSCQEKAGKTAGMGFSHIMPNSDFESFKTILSPKDFESDGDPAVGLIASCLADIPKSKTYTSASGSVCTSLDYLQRYSLQTLFGDFHKYENPANVCQLSKTEMPQICDHEFKGKAQDNGFIHPDINDMDNRQLLFEGTGTRIWEPSITKETGNAESLPVETNCLNRPPDAPPMIDVLCNNISPPQKMDSHFKRIEDFLANCSKGGDNALLKANSEGLRSSSIQNASSAGTISQFGPVLDILSSDCHPPKPTSIFPAYESTLSYSSPWSVEGDLKSSAQSVEGGFQSIPELVDGGLQSFPQTVNGDLRPGHLLRSSMKKTAAIMYAKSLNEAINAESFDQVSFGTDADSSSETMRPGNGLSSPSKEVVDSGNGCHKLVHTMHNLSLLLLSGCSSSDKLGESEFQVLQSVICNLSECLVERMGLSTSVGTALKPEKSVISANIDRTLKGCPFVGEAVERTGSSHISAEVVQSQVVNVEESLNSVKFEMSLLRRELEIERLKNRKGEREIGHCETISVNNNSGSCTEGILGIKRNYLDDAVTQILQQRSVGIPDLNLNPTLQTDATNQNTQIPDTQTDGEMVEDRIKDLLEGRRYQINACNPPDREILTESSDPSCSKLNAGWKEIRSGSYDNLMERWGITSATQTSDMGELLSKERTIKSSPDNMSSSTLMHSAVIDSLKISENVNLLENTLFDSSPFIDSCVKETSCYTSPFIDSCVKETKEDQNEILSEKNIEAQQLNPEDNHSTLDDRSYPGNSVVEDGLAVEIPTDPKSVTCYTDLGNINDMHTSEENPSSESDSGWEYVNNSEGEHFYSFDETDFNLLM